MRRLRARLGSIAPSMRSRLTMTMVLVAVVPLLAVVTILGRWTYGTIERQHLHHQEEVAARVATELRSVLGVAGDRLALLDEVFAFGTQDVAAQRATLDGLLASERIYEDVALVAPDGQGIMHVSRSRVVVDAHLASWANDDLFLEAIESGEPRLGEVVFDERVREPLAPLAVPLHNRRTGEVDSVFVANVSFEPIWQALGELGEEQESDVYVATESGMVIAHRNPAVVLGGAAVEVPTANGQSLGLSGERAVMAVDTLEAAGRSLVVIAEQPTSVALGVATRVGEIAAVVAVIALLAAMALSRLAARHMVRPIEELAESAQRITEGDLPHRAPLSGPNELRHLARAFNSMTEQLSEVIGTLRQRLKDRTLDLEDAAAAHRQLIAQLEAQASRDFLTGLPNRYALDNRLQIELNRAQRLQSRVAVHMIDLDSFKDVNDTYGHAAGDQLLKAVGGRLRGMLREVDAICRLGGDEFAVIQPDITDWDNAAQLAERLLHAFDAGFDLGGHEVFAGASIGVSVSNGSTTSKSEILKQADLALYRAKQEGRNTYRFFDGEMDAAITRRRSLAQDLRRAVARDELFLEYQPQVGLGDRRIVAVEALLRWQHPEFGLVAPTEVVPIAEGVGLIDSVGEWVLRTACAQAKSWQRRELPALPVAVNVSALQLRDPGFIGKVSTILEDTDLDPRYLEIELTERVLVEGTRLVEQTLDTLCDLGIRLCLDDFGKGYASLDYLRRFPLKKVKIDKSFIHDMEVNSKGATIVSAVIDLAEKLDLRVTAEGVEAERLVPRLIDEGCHEAQGFFFSEPIPAEDVAELLALGNGRIRAPAA